MPAGHSGATRVSCPTRSYLVSSWTSVPKFARPGRLGLCYTARVYPNSFMFSPEMFLRRQARPRRSRSWACSIWLRPTRRPGRHMVLDSFWIASISILATFNVEKSVGEDKKIIGSFRRIYLISFWVCLPVQLTELMRWADRCSHTTISFHFDAVSNLALEKLRYWSFVNGW